ncbi:hypothetical protein NL676_007770 [Syzygium grande]|nr:hypothetical protein NL676_007770 [Syzygium grande]
MLMATLHARKFSGEELEREEGFPGKTRGEKRKNQVGSGRVTCGSSTAQNEERWASYGTKGREEAVVDRGREASRSRSRDVYATSLEFGRTPGKLRRGSQGRRLMVAPIKFHDLMPARVALFRVLTERTHACEIARCSESQASCKRMLPWVASALTPHYSTFCLRHEDHGPGRFA